MRILRTSGPRTTSRVRWLGIAGVEQVVDGMAVGDRAQARIVAVDRLGPGARRRGAR